VPTTGDVLVYTDVVAPQGSMSIHFRVPSDKGRYPFLCTFPGHRMVMNGEMLVE
jgi:azurin